MTTLMVVATHSLMRGFLRPRLIGSRGAIDLPVGSPEWIDWDQRGRIIMVSHGQIWAARLEEEALVDARPLIDLSDDRFAPMEAPEWAAKW